MNCCLQFLLGLGFTIASGFVVKPFLAWLRKKIVVPTITDDPSLSQLWRKLQEHPEASGAWVGHFERVVLFGAVFATSWEVIGIWLAFKLAAKWEAWNHMGYVPEVPANDVAVQPLRWAYARRVWAAQGYATFVVGTATNLILAVVGTMIARNGTSHLALVCQGF